MPSTLGFPVHHQLQELAQTHVHWVSDDIQQSHPLSSPASGSFPVSQFFASGGQILELQLQHQSFQWIFKVDFLKDWLVWSPCCPRDSQESSPAPQFKSINSTALSLLYGPTLTSIPDSFLTQNSGSRNTQSFLVIIFPQELGWGLAHKELSKLFVEQRNEGIHKCKHTGYKFWIFPCFTCPFSSPWKKIHLSNKISLLVSC